MNNKIDKFEIISKLGEGGMAKVYLVRDPGNSKLYAAKELVINEKEPQRRKRFEQEMKIYSRVKSPYIAQFYAGKITGTDKPFMLMEYVDGVMLKDYIKRQGGYLHHSIAARIASELTAGFAEIHSAGIIHRDIKTSNVMIQNETNFAKIIDFGIALTSDVERLTSTGKIIGSVHYLAPEILLHEEPSVQSDIYALGIMLFEMLTGVMPFSGGDSLQIINMHKTKQIPDILEYNKEVPTSLINIVLKATAKDKRLRYQSMLKFKEDLDRYLQPRNAISGSGKFQNNEKKNFFGRFFKK